MAETRKLADIMTRNARYICIHHSEDGVVLRYWLYSEQQIWDGKQNRWRKQRLLCGKFANMNVVLADILDRENQYR